MTCAATLHGAKQATSDDDAGSGSRAGLGYGVWEVGYGEVIRRGTGGEQEAGRGLRCKGYCVAQPQGEAGVRAVRRGGVGDSVRVPAIGLIFYLYPLQRCMQPCKTYRAGLNLGFLSGRHPAEGKGGAVILTKLLRLSLLAYIIIDYECSADKLEDLLVVVARKFIHELAVLDQQRRRHIAC